MMNELEIRKFLDVIHPDDELFEIRIIENKGRSYSGYFRDSNDAYNAIKSYSDKNIYVTLNSVNEACYSRKQRDVILLNQTTTSDQDIVKYKWILIDIDPKRPSGSNSSESEMKAAYKVVGMIGKFLKDEGFNYPLYGMSGNGYHLLYRVDIENTDENKELIKSFLWALSMLFSTDLISVDKTVFNPSRISKVLGTHSRKGTDQDADRPQRLSRLLHVPDEVKINDISLVRKIADMLPKQEKASYKNNYGKEIFDIDKFISNNGIGVARDFTETGIRKIVLEECPFDSSHKAPDSAIFVMQNGALGFKCFHNSCAHNTWATLRDRYEPDRKSYQDTHRVIRKPLTSDKQVARKEKKDIGSKFLQMREIEKVDRSKIVSIPTGYAEIDQRITGLNKGEVTLLSGTNGSGKSTWVNQIALNAVQNGFNVDIFSGELKAERMKMWLHLQAAGRQYVKKSLFSDYTFYVEHSVGNRIDEWIDDKLHIYNNGYGNEFNQLMADLKQHVVDKDVDLLILDNLMAIDILMLEGTENQQQTKMINELIGFSKEYNVHIILIAHPRKTTTFLRKNDISGTANLSNAVDNIFIIHRVNKDFVRQAGEFFGAKEAAEFFHYGNVAEMCKNRDLGAQDELYGFYFEFESKRFLTERLENIKYGWLEDGGVDMSEIYSSGDIEPNIDFETGEILPERKTRAQIAQEVFDRDMAKHKEERERKEREKIEKEEIVEGDCPF